MVIFIEMALLVICNLRVYERARYVFADTAKKCYSKYNKITGWNIDLFFFTIHSFMQLFSLWKKLIKFSTFWNQNVMS